MPTAHTSETPASGNVDNGAPITTGVRFMVAGEVTCTSIDFYVPGTNTGVYAVGLYQVTADDDPAGSSTGTELATGSVDAGDVTAGTWGSAPITPTALSPGVVYAAARHSSSGRYVASAGGLASAITAGGVTLIADGADPNPPALGSLRNGVFEEGALTYPRSTFGQADYFVDVGLGAGVTGELAATLPAMVAAVAATASSDGAATVTLPAMGAALSASASAEGVATVTLPAFGASLAGEASATAALAASMPAMVAAFRETPAVPTTYQVGPPELKWSVGAPAPVWTVGPVEV